MPEGPGKYDDICTLVREATGAMGVVVLVIDGNLGHGFSVQATGGILPHLPRILQEVVDEMDATLSPSQSQAH